MRGTSFVFPYAIAEEPASRRFIKMKEPGAGRKSQSRMKSMHETHFRNSEPARILGAR